MPKELKNIYIENATLMFKNFAGRPGPFNAEGDRNFCVQIDESIVQGLEADGWNIKRTNTRDEDDESVAYLPVSVKYRGRDGKELRQLPTIVLITSQGKTDLDEEMSDLIDQSDIAKVDLVIRPYEWVMNGKTGVKAYLKAIYVTLEEDKFTRRYAAIPEIGASQQPLAIESGAEDVWDAEVVEDNQLSIES